MEIRKYKLGEEAELHQIFYSSIRQNANTHYKEDQLIAWAPEDFDTEKWEDRIRGINPYVIAEDGLILGYADLQESGYIDHFFVRGGHSNKGIGKELMTYIIDTARDKDLIELTADVSLAAQAFFKLFGFEIVKRKEVKIRGVLLENALMKLSL